MKDLSERDGGMILEKSQCEKIVIKDIKELGNITVFLEDLGPRKGQITIKCYNKTWSSFWGGMGDRTISKFFCSCDNHYLAKKLSDTPCDISDYDGLRRKAKMAIGKRIKSKDITLKIGKTLLWDLAECEIEHQDILTYNTLTRIFDTPDWMFDVPTKPNHEYQYLLRVINAVKEALGYLY